jgi:hypothetical protein
MNELTLYENSEELVALEELLSMDGGEITPEYLALEKRAMDSIALKTDSYTWFYNKMNDEIAAADDAIARMGEFIKARMNARNRLIGMVERCMELTGKDCFSGIFTEIKKRKPSKIVQIDDESKLPFEYCTVETVTKIDKKKISEALKNDVIVDGASLVDGKTSIMFGSRPVSKSKKQKDIETKALDNE